MDSGAGTKNTNKTDVFTLMASDPHTANGRRSGKAHESKATEVRRRRLA